MIDGVFQELVAAWIGAIIGIAIAYLWSFAKTRFGRQYVKFTYFRVIRLRFRHRGDAPYYTRTHQTISGVKEEVYDETWSMNAAQCNIPDLLEPITLTSSGIVDAVQILPVLDHDADNHPHSRDDARVFTYTHPTKSTSLGAVGTMVNGLQNSKDWWFGTTSQYDKQTMILIVDFTSLPFESSPIRNVETMLERHRQVVPKASIQSQWFEDRVRNDLYYVKFTGSQKGDVVRISFDIDLTDVPKKTSRRRSPRAID